MAKAVDVALVVILLALSQVGMAAAAWSLGTLFTSTPLSELRTPPAPVVYLIVLAVIIEAIRFFIAYHGKPLWRTSRFEGFTIALPIWLLCTMYFVLIPFLALLLVPVPALPHTFVSNVSLSWLCIQLAAAIVPSVLQPAPVQSEMVALAAMEAGPEDAETLTTIRPTASRKARPKQAPAPAAASSADELFQVLAKFARMPEGSKLGKRGRVGADGEIVLSQKELADLIHRSNSTVRRWLLELEHGKRITKLASGKQPTRLLIQHQIQPSNSIHPLLAAAARSAAPATTASHPAG